MPGTGGGSRRGRCESCGRDDEVLEPVRRIYLTVDHAGATQSSDTAEAVEAWCLSCRTLYPHAAGTES